MRCYNLIGYFFSFLPSFLVRRILMKWGWRWFVWKLNSGFDLIFGSFVLHSIVFWRENHCFLVLLLLLLLLEVFFFLLFIYLKKKIISSCCNFFFFLYSFSFFCFHLFILFYLFIFFFERKERCVVRLNFPLQCFV